MSLLIITQILALVCNVVISFTQRKIIIQLMNILYNLICIFIGLLQSEYSLCISSVVIIYRSVAIIWRDTIIKRVNWFPLTFIVAHIVLGIATYEHLSDIITVVAPIMFGLVMWYSDNLQIIRLTGVVSNILWAVYSLSIGTYILASVDFINAIIPAIALYKNRKRYANKTEVN